MFERLKFWNSTESNSDERAEKLINEVIPEVTIGHTDQEKLVILMERPGDQLIATQEAKDALDQCRALLGSTDLSDVNRKELEKAVDTIHRIYRGLDDKIAA